jgi:heat shock protein HtpX
MPALPNGRFIAPRAAPNAPAATGMGGALQVIAALLAALVLLALIVTVAGTVVWLILGTTGRLPAPDRHWPRLTNIAIAAIPLVALVLAALLARRGGGATFYQQQANNRRIAWLFLVALVGLLTVLGEVIVASVTFDAYAALAGAGVSALVGVAAAMFAHAGGASMVIASTGARPTDAARDAELVNVVREISIAAGMPAPRTYVIEDPALNAMAVGTRRGDAAVAVTRGMLEQLDREQLQGVIGHELAHIRNYDSRYGVYVAILVGLVALVTDGFLRVVVRAWAEGVFFRFADADDAKGAIAGLAAGVVFGLFLLLVALFLRLFAPLTALLVQAAVSRQREYLADATSVELTRNPVGLARALREIAEGGRPLRLANRGSQHLWFSNPLGHADDVGWHMLATHPTLESRLSRLRDLYPAGLESAPVAGADSAAATAPAASDGSA